MIRGGVGQGPVVRGRPLPRRGPAQPPSRPVQQEEHRQELEALRAQLEAERLRSQELQRRFAKETRELKERAEQERQHLAEQLRSKGEQERAQLMQRLQEQAQKHWAAEIRYLLRENTKLRKAQELLQQQRDAAVRQVQHLQRQLAEELAKRGQSGSSAALGKQQGVDGHLRLWADRKQGAHIQHRLQTPLGTGATGPCSSKRPAASGAAGGGGQQTTHPSLKDAHLQRGGKSSGRSVADVGVQVPGQQEPCPPGSGDSRFLEQKAQLQHALEDLGRQCRVLQEETQLLKKEEGSLVEAREKAGRLRQKVSILGLLTQKMKKKARQLKELASKSGQTAAKMEQVDQQQRRQLETKAGKNLQLQRSQLRNRYEELKVHLAEVRNEMARREQVNSQLRRQEERIEEIQSENAALRQKLMQVTEQRNAVLGAASRLQTGLELLDCERKAMNQLAERMQQQKNSLEERKQLLQKKEEEVKHWQKAWAELRRTHEEEMQASRAQLRELEQQYQHQSQQRELLSQQLEQEKRKKTSRNISELPQAMISPTAQAYAEQSSSDSDSSGASEKATKILGFYTSSSASDATTDIPGCCLLSDKGSVGGNGESGTEHGSVVSDDDQATTPELGDPLQDSDMEVSSCSRRGRRNRNNKSF